jgi:putative transposase
MKTYKKAARYQVQLSPSDRSKCEAILRGGHCWVWRAKRAQLLLAMDQGKRNAREASERVGMCENAARRVVKRYLDKKDLEFALSDEERPGGKPLLTENQGSVIIAMVCGPAPQGRARWSIRLIAQEAVHRGIVPKVSKETIRILLGSHELKPWREKNVGHPRIDARVRGSHGRGSGSLPEAA